MSRLLIDIISECADDLEDLDVENIELTFETAQATADRLRYVAREMRKNNKEVGR